MTPSKKKILKVLDGMTYSHAASTLAHVIQELADTAQDDDFNTTMAIKLYLLADRLHQQETTSDYFFRP